MTTNQAVEKMRAVIRLKHLAKATEDAYCGWLARYGRFVAERVPELKGYFEKRKLKA